MLLEKIQGHKNTIKYLCSIIAKQRLAKTYLFFGPEGVGRELTANAFIMELICKNKHTLKLKHACEQCNDCRKILNKNHPDIKYIDPEQNKTIKIDQIREIKKTLQLKPYSLFNVCIIKKAHMMTIEASNAFLKILEEPTQNSLIILITNKKELLLPTIVSRCTQVGFNYLSIQETMKIVKDKIDISQEDLDFIISFSQGSPGLALQMIENKLNNKKDRVLTFLNNIVQDKTFSFVWDNENKNELIEDLDFLILFFRNIVLKKEIKEKTIDCKIVINNKIYDFFKTYSIDKIYNILEKILELKQGLLNNMNPKIIAQNLVMCFK